MNDWSKISPNRFEQLCTEILQSEGFYNIRRLGSSGDRGRDIVAYKQLPLLYGSKETQKWIVQCKRYTSSSLTIKEIGDELNKVRMHNPDYYAILLTNNVNPNTFDWLEGIASQYPFKIKLFDEDWLNVQLKRQPSLYDYFFESQGRYSTSHVERQSTDLQVYTAGQMPSGAVRGEMTWWRIDLESAVARLPKRIGFYHPEFFGCDHTGINLSETVQADFRMIANSNLLIAYLERDELYGTLTEIMIAYSMFKQIAVFIDSTITTEISVPESATDDENANAKYYEEVYQKIFKTRHTCPCDLMNELEPIHLNNYWFLIEFLRLRQPDTFIQMTSKENAVKDMLDYLKAYTK